MDSSPAPAGEGPGEIPGRDDGVDRGTIAAADAVIRPYVRRTPIVEAEAADFGLDAGRVAFKLELLQHAGSFKTRGAFANLLLRAIPERGVVAASGGNHGAAVAHAARALGIPARIFVPRVSSPAKIRRIQESGADLVVVGERYADALLASRQWAAESGALPVHAFDQRETLLGTGTLGREESSESSRKARPLSRGRSRRDVPSTPPRGASRRIRWHRLGSESGCSRSRADG